MSLRVKLRDRCMCQDAEETCQIPLNKLLVYYTKLSTEDFFEQKNLERFGISLFNLTPKAALDLMAMLFEKLSDLLKEPGSRVEVYDGAISSVWEFLEVLFSRLEPHAQRAFLLDLERCFKENHKSMQGIIDRMQEGAQDVEMWRLRNEEIKKDMDQLKHRIQYYPLMIEFKDLSAETQSTIRFSACGSTPVTFFLLGAVRFVYLELKSRRISMMSTRSLLNAISSIMGGLLTLIKGHDIKYLECIELSLEREKHTLGRLAGYRNILWHTELQQKNAFLATIERKESGFSEQHLHKIRERLLKITTRFQPGNLVKQNTVEEVIKSLQCIRRVLGREIPASERDQFYFRYVQMLQMWREKSINFNEKSKQLPLYVRELESLLNQDAVLKSRFPYTVFSEFYSGTFMATTTKYLHQTAKLLAQETRLFEIIPLVSTIANKLGKDFFEQRSLSRFSSEASESENELMLRHGSHHSLTEAKRMLREVYRSRINKMEEARLRYQKSEKNEAADSMMKKSKTVTEAMKLYFHRKVKEKKEVSSGLYLEELQNSLSSLEILLDLTYRCLSKEQPQVQLLCFLLFPSVAEDLAQKGKSPFVILTNLMGPQRSKALIVSDTALETHFAFLLGLVECFARYRMPETADSLQKYLKHFKIKYSSKNVMKFYAEKAKEFLLEEAQFLEELHCRAYVNTTPQICAFFYVTYALGNLAGEEIVNMHETTIAHFYSTVVEMYPLASVHDQLWRVYWVLLPVLGKNKLYGHLKTSGRFLISKIASYAFSEELQWGDEKELAKGRKCRKDKKRILLDQETKQKPKSMQSKLGGAKRSLAATRQTQLTEMFTRKREKVQEEVEQAEEVIQVEEEVFREKSKAEQEYLVEALKSYLYFVVDFVKTGARVEYDSLWFKSSKYCWSCQKCVERDRMYIFNELFIYCPECQVENVLRVSVHKPDDIRHETDIAPRYSQEKLKYFEGKKKVLRFDTDQRDAIHELVSELITRLLGAFQKKLEAKKEEMTKSKKANCTVLSHNKELNLIDKIGKMIFSVMRDILLADKKILLKEELRSKVEQCVKLSVGISDYYNGLKEKIRATHQLLEEESLEVDRKVPQLTLSNVFKAGRLMEFIDN